MVFVGYFNGILMVMFCNSDMMLNAQVTAS